VSPAWTLLGVGLNVGTNRIVVTGTNVWGFPASDTVTVRRLPSSRRGWT